MRLLKLTIISCAMVFSATSNPSYATPTPQEILAASDAVRNPDYPFGLTNTLIEYKNGQQTDTSTLGIYSKADPSSGQFRSLIRYIAPQRDANKLILYSGKDLWFYDPSSKASIRMSPQQRLLGQASNGDVVTVNLAKDYKASSAVEEDTQDGDRQTKHCYKVAMQADTPDATYHHIDMWIEVGNFHPIKARFYADSNKLLKSAYYRRYEKQLGLDRPTETVIIDGLDPKWVTVMRYSDLVKRDVPDLWLQREYLPRFKPQ
ncbi:outer membrane lipoprotein-sorting protein [Sapientia aquatica]|uniref:Outer membrane lipoprotein-sorting protein n=2 Tax=Sapientia aquatica TaxID=1549640 RepID=A0A4R5W0A3_9BURK|nr:outer membrane lipoprotein-sorting protein [Sapientia aquatica]